MLTTQNVHLEFEVAGIGDRIFAFIIDTLIIYGWMILIFYGGFKIFEFDTIEVQILVAILALVPAGLYHILLELLNNGQSVGKAVRKIKVIRIDGSQPTMGNYIIRWLLRIVEIYGLFGAALIAILFSGKGQRVGDMAAGTTVAKLKKRVGLEDTILSFTQEGYQPVYPQVKNFTNKDIEIIKEAISYYNKNKHYQLFNAVGDKVRTVMDLKETPLTEEFLNRVVKDYTYYQSLED